MSAGPAVHAEGLTRDFGALRAVDHLDLVVPRNSVFGFLGPNGAGKTTTLRLLLGLLEPTGGRALIFGRDPSREGETVRAECGALLEHHGLYERLTAVENLDFYARINRMGCVEARARMQELLEGFELWERRGDRVSTWSKGMKQKLAIARAMMHRPSLLLLDEPTAGLDARSAAALRQDLLRLVRAEDVTVFLTTHNLGEAEQICDSVGIFREGRLLAMGVPEELRRRATRPGVEVVGSGMTPEIVADIRARPDVLDVALDGDVLRIDLAEGADAPPLVALLVGRGVEISEVRGFAASLEEVFLSLLEDET